jgi:hypothetical protein
MTIVKTVRQVAARLRPRGGRRGKGLTPTLYCSFCGKSQHQVHKLIAGPTVYICDECVAICNKCLDLPIDTPRPKSEVCDFQDLEAMPNERLLVWLKTQAAAYEHVGAGLQRTVDILREREVSWAAIGEALGISRQAAWDRFS